MADPQGPRPPPAARDHLRPVRGGEAAIPPGVTPPGPDAALARVPPGGPADGPVPGQLAPDGAAEAPQGAEAGINNVTVHVLSSKRMDHSWRGRRVGAGLARPGVAA